jgi:hypothetical protein
MMTGIDQESLARIAALRQGLDKFGWTEGRNIQVDYRWASGDAASARRQSDRVNRASAFGTKRTSNCRPAMSAFGSKADIACSCRHVRL